ncbi:MAG TPA: XRE family transcriptional regulator [Sedimenticola sp.]|nr:XRE family transcriptional regulator [Sedimenticola sp.]
MTIEHTTPADANIFEELGLPDAENLKLRAQLMVEVRRYVEESGLTQVAAAKAMKTTQPRLNEVLHGRIDKCSIDRLVQMLSEVGWRVAITVSANKAA